MLTPLPVCLTADIEFEIRGGLTYPDRCTPVGVDSVFRPHQGINQGLDKLLEPLAHHALPATFFIETLQCLHFGVEPMRRVIDQLKIHGNIDIQLHAHPCWSYLANDDWRQTVGQIKKNDSMSGRGVTGAKEILKTAIDQFQQLTGQAPVAFRSGSLKIDADLIQAQAESGISISSCVGRAYFNPQEPQLSLWAGTARFGPLTEVPVTSYQLGIGSMLRPKLLTITGTPFPTMKRLLENSWQHGVGPIVFLTHASEMAADTTDIYTPPSYSAHAENQQRWSNLCEFLDRNRDRFQVLPLGSALDYWTTLEPASHAPYRGGLRDLASATLSRWMDKA